MTTWYVINFRGAVAHLVPSGLRNLLIADMTGRDMPMEKFENGDETRDVTEWGITWPGFYLAGQPRERFTFAGLKLEIPSGDVRAFFNALKRLDLRKFGAISYYKLHGYAQAIVLTPRQRTELLRALEDRVVAAEKRFEMYFSDWKNLDSKPRSAEVHDS